jgi:hypothetical protein
LGGNDVKTLLASIVTTLGLILACAVHAQAPAAAPAGTTGQCKDGTWYSGASKKGACHGHQGVKEWYGAADAASTTTTKSTATTSTSATPASASTSPKQKTTASSASTASTSAPAAAPAGTTGLCNDGTYYSGESKRGACHGHKGVKTWYGATAATTATPAVPAPTKTATPTAMPASTPAAMPTKSTTAAPAAMPATHSMTPASTSPAPGGGAGKVWVNSSSKVYHCSGDRYYGTTKEGEYMSEADAIAKGNRAAHGKACSS